MQAVVTPVDPDQGLLHLSCGYQQPEPVAANSTLNGTTPVVLILFDLYQFGNKGQCFFIQLQHPGKLHAQVQKLRSNVGCRIAAHLIPFIFNLTQAIIDLALAHTSGKGLFLQAVQFFLPAMLKGFYVPLVFEQCIMLYPLIQL